MFIRILNLILTDRICPCYKREIIYLLIYMYIHPAKYTILALSAVCLLCTLILGYVYVDVYTFMCGLYACI